MNLNKAFVLGNVTRDPEVRSMPSGQQVASFGIATNRFYTDGTGQKKQDVEFHNIVAFGKLADIAQRFLTKGSLVLIEGRIKTRNWQNQQGAKQYRTEIIAEGLQLGPRPGGGGGPYNRQFPSQSQDLSAGTGQAQPPKEDIPIIEENYIPPVTSASNEEPPREMPSTSSDEIDIKDIPF